MTLNNKAETLFQGFSKLTREQRYARLVEMGALNTDDISFLKNPKSMNADLAEHFIENVIGYFHLPLGVATHFRINHKDYVIPMAVEETSIIAALSKTAKWIRNSGSLSTETIGKNIIGQIQLAKIKNLEQFKTTIEANKTKLIAMANEMASGLVKRGGGVKDLQIRLLDRGDGSTMAVLHVLADPCNAMGANIITQVCEHLKKPIEELTGETVTLCILSNLCDEKLTRAQVRLHDIDPQLGASIAEASLFAELDPYRAATHNKGVLNGIDPVLIATGNDWRAVEAGIHAYACRDGQYRPITTWRMEGTDLVGRFEAPVVVGTVGGVTRLHPTAQLALKMLGIEDAEELSQVAAAVGLVQNLGALRALTTFGFIEGHMKLHITNLSLSAGANASEMPLLSRKLEELLQLRKQITLNNARELLKELRAKTKILSTSTAS